MEIQRQWEFGRSMLLEIGDMLQKIEIMPNIEWVRVALHDDIEIVENNWAEEFALAGDTTRIYRRCNGVRKLY